MSDLSYHLESENGTILEAPSTSDVVTFLEGLRAEDNSFVILGRSDGCYVQTAGARTGLTIEWREVDGEEFHHVVLGLGEPAEDAVTIECSVGEIEVGKHELLTATEAEEVFKQFLSEGTVPARFALRDMTHQFLEGDDEDEEDDEDETSES